ncbi:hypothetical protein [Rickettsia bellii]|uniref:hypothetical protein n=1 Tax=Rickettsia bellii TaxID=33990 RepID=UPI001E324AF0|nr:hypothetical protein [Rickettsia bellii]
MSYFSSYSIILLTPLYIPCPIINTVPTTIPAIGLATKTIPLIKDTDEKVMEAIESLISLSLHLVSIADRHSFNFTDAKVISTISNAPAIAPAAPFANFTAYFPAPTLIINSGFYKFETG